MTHKKEAPSPARDQGLTTTHKQAESISLQAQQQRILNHLLSYGSLTTVEARRFLDIMHPAARVMELKRQGHPIETHLVNALTECGKTHRVAIYQLATEL